MKRRVRNYFPLILFVLCCSFIQLKDFNFTREIDGITDTWHKIVLPNGIFGKASQDLSDLRIIGFTEQNDTIEAPYILRQNNEQITEHKIEFKIINTTHNKEGYFYTFQMEEQKEVNKIILNFNLHNFDWQIRLEGSENQKEWFTVLENYRVLSISNGVSNYSFTTLNFPDAKYHYYRLFVPSKINPDLNTADITEQKIVAGSFRNCAIKSLNTKNDKAQKQTIVDIDLGSSLPVSHIKIRVKDTFDFYRPVTIQYCSDSFKTPTGYKYYYTNLSSSVISSLEENELKFRSTTTNKLRILINNYDNEPLALDTFSVRQNVYELLARFTKPAKYFLVYGNSGIGRPDYDIDKFKDRVPSDMKELSLGPEQTIEKLAKTDTGKTPLFQNKMWLWAIMGLIILILGGFSIRMMKEA
ncbi:MAG: hypothetical protein JWO06_2956 [Bacteroidota bacterium]|nr:hypothetical protein [Bacteroidota bacterium]